MSGIARVALPPSLARAGAVTASHALGYRRVWRATVTTAFLNPIFFLLSMGVLLGGLVDDSSADLGGLSYLQFVAPGLLAAMAMQVGTNEATFPVMAGVKWLRTYHAVVATPVRVAELVAGMLAWVALRIVMAVVVFSGVATVAGAFLSPWAVLAPAAALLCGMAFAAPIAAFAASLEDESAIPALMRFGIVPMFLFSGTFFPVEQLPEWLEPVAWATPLWHGVALCRSGVARGCSVPGPRIRRGRLARERRPRRVPAALRRRRRLGGRPRSRAEAAQVTAVTLAARVLPRAALGGNRSWRLVQRNLVASRRYWLVIVSGFFEPLFYLVGIGIGVGTLVGDLEVGGRDVSYQEFVAPALLAASAMNGAVYETTGNVFFKLKYARTYEGVLATPLRVGDVALAELTFALMRGTVYGIAFVLVMLALGLVGSAWAILLVPSALLVGAAFAAAGLAATSMMRSWADFGYIELATLPLFLFSATFVPLDEYPEAAQWILPLTPLYHGVELLRAFTLGDVGLGVLAHVGYLLVMVAVGLLVAARRLEQTLLK